MKRKLSIFPSKASSDRRRRMKKTIDQPNTSKSFDLKGIASITQEITSAIFKIGTLVLVCVVLVWLFRAVSREGYTIEPFSVPKHLAESGYDGIIVARKIQDQVQQLKEEAQSTKTDSLQLIGNDNPDLNVSLLSVGFSLNSLTYHLRDLIGRKNYTIRGEITQISDTYTITVRMTDYPLAEHKIVITAGDNKSAIEQTIRKGGEAILMNTDPYRLAVVCYQNKRFRDGMNAVQRVIEEHPNDAHWAYLAWGRILMKQNNPHSAVLKFKEATKLKPDFVPAWAQLAWTYQKIKQHDLAAKAMRKSVVLDPNNIRRIHNAAWFFHVEQQYEVADSLFAQAIVVAPEDPIGWTSWADSKTGRGEVEEAIQLLARAEPYLGSNLEGLLIKAFSSFIQQDTMEALNYVEAAFELAPHSITATFQAMRGYSFKNNYDRVIEIAEQADWENMDGSTYQKQGAMNIWAMALNQKGNHDAAFSVIREAIALGQDSYAPYTTLAETFAFTNEPDSFYYYLEYAFQNGFDTKWVTNDLSESPYDVMSQEQRFIDLIAKYEEETKLKG